MTGSTDDRMTKGKPVDKKQSESPDWLPHVTVATVIEKQGRFLMVEESIHGRLILNQPAGHLNQGETLVDAAVRETLEETGWHVRVDHLIEIAQWTSPNSGTHFVRACFAGSALDQEPGASLDDGIVRALWMRRDEVEQNAQRLRSPLVLQHIDHYISGKRFSLEAFGYYDDH